MDCIRIVVADDHAVVRRGLHEVFQVAPGMEVVGEAGDGEEAIRLTTDLEVDVLILDLTMPGPSGVEILRRIRSKSSPTRVLVHTMHDTRAHLSRLLDAGASGYVLKSTAIEGLLQATRMVADGRIWIDPVLAGRVMGNRGEAGADDGLSPSVLSPREEEVLRKVARGHSNKRIGEILGISTRTVETYKARIGKKLGLRDRVQIVEYALAHGWLSLEGEDG